MPIIAYSYAEAVFLSTPSARRATSGGVKDQMTAHNFYPRPPRGGRQQLQQRNGDCRNISIHALREEGDPCDLGSN